MSRPKKPIQKPENFLYCRCDYTHMAIKRHKRGNRVYLAEYKNVREGKKVKSIFLRYLGPEEEVKAGKTPKKRVLDRLKLRDSYSAGDVRLLWYIAQDLKFIQIIDRICCGESYVFGLSPGKLITMWAINRALDPMSCTKLAEWVPTTVLPELAEIEPAYLTKDAFLSALDFVCYYDSARRELVDHTSLIEELLYQQWRQNHPLPAGKNETLVYDMTSILFFGTTCPLSALGIKSKNGKKQLQVNLALLASKHDKYPITHFVFEGNRNSKSTIKNLVARLQEMKIEPGVIIWDRGNISQEHVKLIEKAGWKLIAGLPRTMKKVKELMGTVEIPINAENFIKKSRNGYLYGVELTTEIIGKNRKVILYVNQNKRMNKINEQNYALSEIERELTELNMRSGGMSEGELHKKIKEILNEWSDCIEVHVKRKVTENRIEWKLKKRSISRLEKTYGKGVILKTDENIGMKEAVGLYFEKDVIEKIFRTVKTEEKVEPVRHRLESRVRAYLFVCMLGYRVLCALRYKMTKITGDEESWSATMKLLDNLRRVEQVDVKFGKEVKRCYLNKTKYLEDKMKALGYKDFFKEEIRLEM